MTTGKLSIHSENILPIIKKWLYSDQDIFLRELVSNAVDASNKRKILENQNLSPKEKEYRIDVLIDSEKKIITIRDHGIGMTKEEVEKYIAQIAFSGASDFIQTYQIQKDQIIGHFGLGFYSAYIVADTVQIFTRSYKEEKGLLWTCDGKEAYTIEEKEKDTIGTDVILHLNNEHREFLQKNVLKTILLRYCPFLPFPIYLEGEHINNKDPLWLKPASEISKNEYLSFYRELDPLEPDPIFWIHLQIDFPFHLKGILYFPKISSNLDITKCGIKLFCNRMFVTDNCKNILPEYLTMLKGAIDSPDLPLNVSRSFLQMDKTVRQLASHISKKIADRLNQLYNTDRDHFISLWEEIHMIVKFAIMQDEKFYEKAKTILIWKNTKNEWLTIEEYLHRNTQKESKQIFYTQQEQNPLVDLYTEKGIDVLLIPSILDNPLLAFLERKLNIAFLRIDSTIADPLLDPSKEQEILDKEGKSKKGKLIDFVRNALNMSDLEIEAKSLSKDSLPSFLLLKEEERRIRDYLQFTKEETSLPTKRTFVVNTNNPLIEKIHILQGSKPDLAKDLIRHLYDLSLISQKEIPSTDLISFGKRATSLLQQIAMLSSQKE